MPISIVTSFHPFRMILSHKKPIELTVELINRGEKDEMLTIQLLLSRQLALDKSGLHANAVKTIDKFAPSERKRYVFDIYPKSYISAGEYPVKIKVFEHYQNYKFVKEEYTKNISITVED